MKSFWQSFSPDIGILSIVLGVCVGVTAAEAETVDVAVGNSMTLTLNYNIENVTDLTWERDKEIIAEFDSGIIKYPKSRFKDRVKINASDLSLTLENLTLQDEGQYLALLRTPSEQLPTKTFIVSLHSQVENIQIRSEVTWSPSKKTCEVHLTCAAHGEPGLSYSWRGKWNGSEAKLNFTLTPAEGEIIQNCSAANKISSVSVLRLVSCRESKWIWQVWVSVAVVVCGAVFLIAVVHYCRTKKAKMLDSESTLYADITSGSITHKAGCSASLDNTMSIYETVRDPEVTTDKPSTVYDKVTFPRPPSAGPTISAPNR